MAGTISVCVTRWFCMSRRQSAALKARSTTMAPPRTNAVEMLAISPVTWLAGTASRLRSPGANAIECARCSAEWTMFRCVSIAPLGRPVVPEV